MTLMNRWAAMALLACSVGVGGCSNGPAKAAQPADAAPTAEASGEIPEVLATIGNEQVTMADVRARVGTELDQMDTRYRLARYNLVDKTLRQLMQERVVLEEARRQGKSLEEMISENGGGEPSDVEIAAWYEENRSRVGGRTLEQVLPQIAQVVWMAKRVAAMDSIERRCVRYSAYCGSETSQ